MTREHGISRRRFLKQAAVTAAAAGFPTIIPASALGADGAVAPSNRVTLGFIGLGTEGKLKNLRKFMAEPEVQVLALCDVHGKRLRSAHLAMQAYAHDPDISQFRSCMTTRDWREVVLRDDIDAIVVSTPDHWHVLPSVAAAQAGKDVLCEKPVSLTVREGRVLSDTMRLYGRVFQVGSEARMLYYFVRACELVRNGRIGKLHTIRVDMYRGFGYPQFDESPPWRPMRPPEDFDYDMWLGQAPEAPFTPLRCHGTFRFIYDYGGGNLAEWGPHILDIAQWGNNTDRSGPVSVEGHGTFPKDGLYNTPTDFEVTFEYANGVKLFVKTGGEYLEEYEGSFVRFEGSDGWVQADWLKLEASSAEILESVIGPDEIHLRTCMYGEHRDFLDCIKSRGETFAPAEVGHRTASLCHLGNISMLLGRKLRWDPDAERFIDDDSANRMLSRPMRPPWRLDT